MKNTKNQTKPGEFETKWSHSAKSRRGKQDFIPGDFEKKWQEIWQKEGVYQPDLFKAKKPFYNLMMFPYPSAEGLHVGNMYAFTGADIYGRFKRMSGHEVFEPIGLDGFGIHSENYAIKVGKHPAEQAKVSQKNFYRQLSNIGNGFAWNNRLETYDPQYYKWTQWIFVTMFKNGLAYRKKSLVNFCSSCKTVLSDEQVIDGACERCKSQVERREMEQWFFKITAYAEKLLHNTYKESFQWTEKVKTGQRNWIGKKEGINITYQVVNEDGKLLETSKSEIINPKSEKDSETQIQNNKSPQPTTIVCFTTRPDTNFGATFVVIAPEHKFIEKILNPKSEIRISNDKRKEIINYIEKAKSKSENDRIAEGREKTGVFTGFYCINQLNGYKIPLYISDFVLGHFGTGAVVGVPGHDMRDFEFAQKFNIPVIRVVKGSDGDESPITQKEQVQEKEGTMTNSGFLDGMDIKKAIGAMMDHLEEKGWGKRVTTYKLRDWCISRQRYWGAPIPMINCPKCNWVPVSEDQLPVLLPANVVDWKPEGTGKGPLAKIDSFVRTKCPACGGDAQRETDVCDTFLDSSWYHMRYPSINIDPKSENRNPKTKNQKDSPQSTTNNSQLPWDPEITKKWLPVTQYIGGAEHTVLHLLYARFVTMVFKDLGLIDFDEPYARFYAHGLIIAEGAKMSKSRGNVIVPDEYINTYGADTLRTYLMFLGPFDMGGDFRDTGIAGMHKFLKRIWNLVMSYELSVMGDKNKGNPQPITHNLHLDHMMHKTIKEVTEDMENLRYNTAISHIMIYVNNLTDNQQLTTDQHIKSLLLMLAPFAPHMTEELWQSLNKETHNPQSTTHNSIHLHSWPVYDQKYLVEDEVTIVIQINGKTKETVKVQSPKSKVQNEVEMVAKNSEKTKKQLEGKMIRKVIFVPGKLINFVV
jgi:leucyl-tRNA synthetase